MLPAPAAAEGGAPAGVLTLAAGSFPATNLNKRGPVACKRCRRAKTKCLHAGNPPCRSCAEAGVGVDCIFPPKGTSFVDRAVPAKRVKRRDSSDAPTSSPNVASSSRAATQQHGRSHTTEHGEPRSPGGPSIRMPKPIAPGVSSGVDYSTSASVSPSNWQDAPYELPPPELIEEACNIFFVRVNQCAFLHKPTFIGRIRDERRPISAVLVLAICALAARFSPALSAFRGTGALSAAYFSDAARRLLYDALDEPTLETCQAGYLLGITDLGAGKGRRGWMVQGIAIRMAFLLGLHRNETHQLPENPGPADIIATEEARRTFWTLYINDCCFSSGVSRPPSILPSEISVALPCDEDSFAFGAPSQPFFLDQLRARGRSGYSDNNTSMMAHMVQSAELWGNAARWACDVRHRHAPPTDANSDYARLKNALLRWRTHLPPRLQYSRANLTVYFQRNLETGLVYNHVIHYSAEIMLRRPYLPFIIRSVAPESCGLALSSVVVPFSPPPTAEFWAQCGKEMFLAAMHIIDIILDYTQLTQSQYATLSPHLGFSTFLASATLTYIWRWPWLLPERAYEVPGLVTKATALLSSMTTSWPMARQWLRILKQPLNKRIDEAVQEDVAQDQREGIYRHVSLSSDAAGASGDEGDMTPGPGVQQGWTAAPSLHALAMAAAESVSRPPPPAQAHGPAPPPVHHVHAQQQQPMQAPHGQDVSYYALPGPYSEMPFGDPTQPQSFGDVVAFMDGVDQWNWPPPV